MPQVTLSIYICNTHYYNIPIVINFCCKQILQHSIYDSKKYSRTSCERSSNLSSYVLLCIKAAANTLSSMRRTCS
jgi:hypothetical protein